VTAKLLFRCWIIFWIVALCLFLYPIRNLPLRAGLILALAAIWLGAIIVSRRHKAAFYSFVSISLLVAGFLLLPGRNPDAGDLQAVYVRALQSYQGTRYVWGGENRFGIDCSGLVRAGMIKADLCQGIGTLNPKLVRSALSLWWYDESANALGKGYRQQTRFLFRTNAIDVLDQSRLHPGDLAVTTSGLHVLAYCGTNTWIEADPTPGRVVIVHVPARTNPWFQQPVNLVRWAALE